MQEWRLISMTGNTTITVVERYSIATPRQMSATEAIRSWRSSDRQEFQQPQKCQSNGAIGSSEKHRFQFGSGSTRTPMSNPKGIGNHRSSVNRELQPMQE
jgi:hypothetical protein